MAEVKVSVIIPVYNTAKYVGEAINSIIGQTLREIEIIIVNDGSQDNSLEIIQSLAAQDSRIQIYNQENKGQSAARNLGITKAIGKYTYFFDSDDILDCRTLEECFNKSEQKELDLLIFDAEIFGGLPTTNLTYNRTSLIPDKIYSGIEILNALFAAKGYSASPCLNFINSSTIVNSKLSYLPGIIHEDELFTFKLYLKSKRVGLINKPFFKRRIRQNSTMSTTFSRQNLLGYYTVAISLVSLKNKADDKRIRDVISTRLKEMLNGVLYNSRSLKINDRVYIVVKCLIRFRKYVTVKNIVLTTFPLLKIVQPKIRNGNKKLEKVN